MLLFPTHVLQNSVSRAYALKMMLAKSECTSTLSACTHSQALTRTTFIHSSQAPRGERRGFSDTFNTNVALNLVVKTTVFSSICLRFAASLSSARDATEADDAVGVDPLLQFANGFGDGLASTSSEPSAASTRDMIHMPMMQMLSSSSIGASGYPARPSLSLEANSIRPPPVLHTPTAEVSSAEAGARGVASPRQSPSDLVNEVNTPTDPTGSAGTQHGAANAIEAMMSQITQIAAQLHKIQSDMATK